MNNNLLNNKIFSKILQLNDEINKLILEKSKDKEKMYKLLYKIRVLQGITIKWLHSNLNKNKNNNNYYYNISILQNLIDETKVIINIAEANIQRIIFDIEEEKTPKFFLFYVDWCPYCINFMPIWDEFTKLNENIKIKLEKIDCTNTDKYKKKYNFSGYPSLLFFDKNDNIHKFDNDRTIKNLQNFINNFL